MMFSEASRAKALADISTPLASLPHPSTVVDYDPKPGAEHAQRLPSHPQILAAEIRRLEARLHELRAHRNTLPVEKRRKGKVQPLQIVREAEPQGAAVAAGGK